MITIVEKETMSDYRTDEQYKDICENMSNGNWTDAMKLCAEAGYYANDLKIKYETGIEGSELITDIWDFVELIEGANKYR
jgi:hypothetical protein